MLRMFSERCESDRVPWSQFVASLCFLLEFPKFLLRSQRLVSTALAHRSQLPTCSLLGIFTDSRINGEITTLQATHVFPCHHLQVLKAAFFFFFILQTIPIFRITLFFFCKLCISRVCKCVSFRGWNNLTSLTYPEREDLVAISLWAILVFLVSSWFRICHCACGPIVLRKKLDILKQSQTPFLAAASFLFPCSHPSASKD